MATDSTLSHAARRSAAAMPARFRPAALVMAAVMAAAGQVEAKTCTRDLSEKEFAGNEAAEVICGNVAVRLMPLRSEMFYRRWSGEIVVRAIAEEAEAKIALAAFDAAGDLVGAASLLARKVGRKPKTIPLRMEGMFTSLSEVKKVLLSVSTPGRKAP